MRLSLSTAIVILAALARTVISENHTIRLTNYCGTGVPILQDRNGTVLSTGSDYVSNGPLAAISYLQNGSQCGPRGENCTVVKTVLQNGIPFSHSSTTLTIKPPYAFTFPTGFSYFNGCDAGSGYCDGSQCPGQDVVVECKEDNVSLGIFFCE